MFVTGVIDGLSDVRWDIRPSPRFGTIEVRVCDGTPTLRELRGLVAFIHALVVHLDERLEAGEQLPTMPPWHVQENKWRAARYGLDAEVIVDAAGRERLVTDDLDEWLNRLEPVARRLECADELALVADIPRRGASYQRQRSTYEAACARGGREPPARRRRLPRRRTARGLNQSRFRPVRPPASCSAGRAPQRLRG